jgi:hypothetical protein
VVITSVSPNPLVEGQPARIQGSGFGLVASNNQVTVGGTVAQVTASTSTTVDFVVPFGNCQPARTVNVQVRLLATPSNVVQTAVRPQRHLELPVGQQILVRDPSYFCLQFGATSASEAYLIGVQSVAENVTSVTQAKLTAQGGAVPGAPPAPMLLGPSPAGPGLAGPTDDDDRLLRQHTAELRALDKNIELFEKLRSAPPLSTPPPAAAPSVPATVREGNVLAVRVPSWDDQCQYTTVNAVVRAIGARSIWLEDTTNPAGGYTAAEYQALANFFDPVFEADTRYFGLPSDIDRNGRIAFVITKEVNEVSARDPVFDLVGWVATANFVHPSMCATSNEGELIYLRAPDPGRVIGRGTPEKSEEILNLALLIPHEFVHAIQFSHAMPGNPTGANVQPRWLIEAQATVAEEMIGHLITGGAPGQNYGAAVAFNQPMRTPRNWYRATEWLRFYNGFLSSTERAAGAPEQCSWVGVAAQGNNGPCGGSDLIVYATGWSFLRWLSDQFGPGMPGGESALHKKLVDSRSVGYAAIAEAVGVPIDSLLAQWSAAQYVDDRVPGAAKRLTFTSWNFAEIDDMRVPTARLTPRERAFWGFSDAVAVRAGSTAYFRVSGAGRPGTAVSVLAPNGQVLPSHMRLWVVRLQ